MQHAYGNRGYGKKTNLEQYEEAIADYDEAIRLGPNDARYHNRGSMQRRKLGQYESAIADYDESLRLKSDAITY